MTDEINDITFCEECLYHGEPNGCNRNGGECKAYYAFLDLQAENAALRERLDKAVILPCKAGDTLFVLISSLSGYQIIEAWVKQIIFSGASTRIILYFEIHGEGQIYTEYEKHFGKTLFLTKAAAEKRLAELGGEK